MTRTNNTNLPPAEPPTPMERTLGEALKAVHASARKIEGTYDLRISEDVWFKVCDAHHAFVQMPEGGE